MHIIHLHPTALSLGKASFTAYLSAVVCGSYSNGYRSGMARKTGVAMVPGSITACIEHGISTRDQILNAVARSTHCSRSTVSTILDELTGTDEAQDLWGCSHGTYFSWDEVRRDGDHPRVLLAA